MGDRDSKLSTLVHSQAPSMRIKAFEEATGLSRHTVRFYERRGLLPAPPRGGDNNYRDYDEALVERALTIKLAQRLGFTLAEIKRSIDDYDADTMSAEDKMRFMEEKIAQIEAQMAGLQTMRGYLADKVAWMRAGEPGLPPSLAGLEGGTRC
jgi:MerR family transcriptional regulator, copper efflux regulator